jgi:hypothetical protein
LKHQTKAGSDWVLTEVPHQEPLADTDKGDYRAELREIRLTWRKIECCTEYSGFAAKPNDHQPQSSDLVASGLARA